MAKMKCAEAIVRFLEKAGTEYVFGLNGHGNWAFLDLIEHESKIKGISVRSEDHAIHMADGYFRMKRQAPIPIVTTTVGPGNTNIVSALANAYFESSAMLVIAGGGATQWFDRGGMEEFYRKGPEEWIQVVKPMTKLALMANRPDTALEMTMRAYKMAVTGRPGPVVVMLPFDIQATEIDVKEIPDPTLWVKIHNSGPDPSAIQEAAQLISKSNNPLLVVSGGIHNSRAYDELVDFVETFKIPVATTFMGKGVISEDHPLSLGVIGRNGTMQAINAARNCDVLIAIGTHFTDIDTGGWTIYDIPSKTKLIHIDIDYSEIARVYPTQIGIVSDAKSAIQELIKELKKVRFDGHKMSPWLNKISNWKAEWEESVKDLRYSNIYPLNYARVCNDASEIIKEVDPETSVTIDTGNLMNFSPAFFRYYSRFISHCGHFHRMGWSAPAAIGAKLANKNHPAVAMIGDGSFFMTGVSLATTVEQDIPIVCVVMNNKSLQIEREAMLKFYGRSSFCDYKINKTGELWNPDIIKFADSMGVEGITINKPEEFKPLFKRALLSDHSVVIDVPINVETPAYRPVWYPYPGNFNLRGLEKPAY
jgi:acetolactate synthase-1/2/3 large subunit